MACYIYLRRLLCRRWRWVASIPTEFSSDLCANTVVSSQHIFFSCPNFLRKRWLSTNAETAGPPELAGMTAYDILEVSRTSSLAEIKASFRRLAKETHPDLAHSQNHSALASRKFVQVLAAYEILSDSTKRAHYDHHLRSKRVPIEQHYRRGATIFKYNTHQHQAEQMEVVEWLKWYRHAINDVLSERRVTSGSGYFDMLERDFYSAMRAAYYGPEIESVDRLPDRFEAEERSVQTTPEVLHLVSGRDLFGMVCLADKQYQLSCAHTEKLGSTALNSVPLSHNVSTRLKSDVNEDLGFLKQSSHADFLSSDAYRDLELHLSGRVIAVATRTPPGSGAASVDEDSIDQIHVYLASCEDRLHADSSLESEFLLGVIKGLGTTSEEATCYVYNGAGVKTHMIMKHRTLLVKHLHWFHVGEKVSVCECRCTRARLPPSKFWLFEPRSAMHDIGGWYIETFGRDNKGKTVPGQRYWDNLDTNAHSEERLHPAVYLLALAYRTLDIEDARRGKKTFKDKVEAKMSNILSWRKKFT
ncbi:Chaperone DnaJ-domain superfamily protein [Striga hermonthica]|uniref:Chaperone DnaJ-domain superfamily protein n=1 Tax=Striga hermonthica TaxID=68872 RepID=A0A9N7NQZ5_STRHE|nr:Chaperone DnaJ-domain superfamily protein [Striga hermonthica]